MKVAFKCTNLENEKAVKLIQHQALTPIHTFINILMEENISLSLTVFLYFEFMALHTFKLLLHNGTIVKKQTKILQRGKKKKVANLFNKCGERIALSGNSLQKKELLSCTKL